MAFKQTVGILSDAFGSAFRQKRQNDQRSLEQTRKIQEDQRQFGLAQQQELHKINEDVRLSEERNKTTREYYESGVRDNYLDIDLLPKELQGKAPSILGRKLNKDFALGTFADDNQYVSKEYVDSLSGRAGRSGSSASPFSFQTLGDGTLVAVDKQNPKSGAFEVPLTGGRGDVNKKFNPKIKGLREAMVNNLGTSFTDQTGAVVQKSPQEIEQGRAIVEAKVIDGMTLKGQNFFTKKFIGTFCWFGECCCFSFRG